MNFSDEIAKKHVQISMKICKDIADYRPDLKLYLATHSERRNYYENEKDSGLEFYGISIYANENPSGSALKQPDGIVVDEETNTALYILEIKWGWIPESNIKSDLLDLVNDKKGADERRKMRNAISNGKSCRIGKRKFPEEDSSHRRDIKINEETEFLLISDFYELRRCYFGYNTFMENLRSQIPELVLLDYKKTFKSNFGDIKCFQDYILSIIKKDA